MGVDARAYRGATEGDLGKLFSGVGEASDAELVSGLRNQETPARAARGLRPVGGCGRS